jgi:L-histidine Nalpha-methyltransferase
MAVGEIARLGGPSPVLRVPAPPVLEWLELGADDRTARFVGLMSDLSRAFDAAGGGKRITSAHAYAGLGAAIAWATVCRDPLGGAPRQSVDSFATRWGALRASAPETACQYVSLGPGDGRKDGVVIWDMSRANRDLWTPARSCCTSRCAASYTACTCPPTG